MIASVQKFRANANGATAIEYRLIAAGILHANIAVVNGMGIRPSRTSPRSTVR
jgi:Flp pilus assembly pilin Flp